MFETNLRVQSSIHSVHVYTSRSDTLVSKAWNCSDNTQNDFKWIIGVFWGIITSKNYKLRISSDIFTLSLSWKILLNASQNIYFWPKWWFAMAKKPFYSLISRWIIDIEITPRLYTIVSMIVYKNNASLHFKCFQIFVESCNILYVICMKML